MPHSMMWQAMCSEILGFESGDSHVTMEILPHDISEPESKLLHICEKRRLAKEPRPPLSPAMPWRGKRIVLDRRDRRLIMSQVPTKLPFAIHASRVDGRLKLSLMHPSDSVNELKVVSNGKKDVEDHAKGSHGENNVEYIEKSSKANVAPRGVTRRRVVGDHLRMALEWGFEKEIPSVGVMELMFW